MKIFSPLYDRVLSWAGHRHAERYLLAMSFAESSFFPVPPDVLLAPMTLARPERGWRFAAGTTLASVVGGIAGYVIGLLALDFVEPLLRNWGYWDSYVRATEWFGTYGFAAILIAGFSPIPYKVFTIAAGALQFTFPLFVIGSIIGRGTRFFLVAALLIWGGPRMEQHLRRHIDTLGWLSVVAIAAAVAIWQLT